MSNPISRIFDNCLPIAQWLLSSACQLCGARAADSGLCEACRSSLPRLPGARCPICAQTLSAGGTCGRCLGTPPHFDRTIAAFSYEFPASALIQQLKYRGNLACARPLAAGLVKALENEPYPDLLIAMPLARSRMAQRGFNQAVEISRHVAREFGLLTALDVCRRNRQGAPQASLPWKQRAANVRNAFACDEDLEGKSVAVVDDVLTTGATLSELARTLKRRGAREVVGWIAARTPAPGDT